MWNTEKFDDDTSIIPEAGPDKKLNKYIQRMKRTSKKLKASKRTSFVVLEYDPRKNMFRFQNMHRPSELINQKFC